MEDKTTNSELLMFMKDQFEKVDQRLGTIDSRFDTVENKLEEHDLKFDAVNRRIDDLANKVFVRGDVLDRIELLEKEVRNLVKQVAKH